MNDQPINHTITAASGANGSGNSAKTIAPYELTARRRRAEAQSLCIGFLTDAHRAQMPHVVRLATLTRAPLGGKRFKCIYGLCKHRADVLAPRDFWTEAVVEDHGRGGYELGFSDKLAALQFVLCHEAAMRGQPLPLPQTAPTP